jgi:hypothetical protein
MSIYKYLKTNQFLEVQLTMLVLYSHWAPYLCSEFVTKECRHTRKASQAKIQSSLQCLIATTAPLCWKKRVRVGLYKGGDYLWPMRENDSSGSPCRRACESAGARQATRATRQCSMRPLLRSQGVLTTTHTALIWTWFQ